MSHIKKLVKTFSVIALCFFSAFALAVDSKIATKFVFKNTRISGVIPIKFWYVMPTYGNFNIKTLIPGGTANITYVSDVVPAAGGIISSGYSFVFYAEDAWDPSNVKRCAVKVAFTATTNTAGNITSISDFASTAMLENPTLSCTMPPVVPGVPVPFLQPDGSLQYPITIQINAS